MERFEAWLKENGIVILGQVASGSGSLVRYQLRLPDGWELALAFPGEVLIERPDEAIQRVESMIDSHRSDKQHTNGHG